MSCAHGGILREEVLKRFTYPHGPDHGEWEVVKRSETWDCCGEVYIYQGAEPLPDPCWQCAGLARNVGHDEISRGARVKAKCDNCGARWEIEN